MTLSEYLKKSRMRQQDFAAVSGCSQSMISRVITGKSKFGSLAALAVAKATSYEVTPHELRPDKALERFTAALTQARDEGFRGQQALNRAHAILWPQPASSVIDNAIHDDDVDFVEQCVLAAFDADDPVYAVGVSYYTTRKKISDITRELQLVAPWLTPEKARERVKWCLQIFRAKTFLEVRHQMSAD